MRARSTVCDVAEVHRDSFAASQYFLAVAGVAMMRKILTRPSEGQPRMAEIEQIIGSLDEFPNSLQVDVVEHTVEEGYTAWAPIYDGPNPAIEAEEPVVHGMVADLQPGRALDAACGTGRHAAHLASQGWDTIGVDATPAMLDVARVRCPAVDLREGRLESLPVDDASVDLVVSALAVCHVPDLDPVLREFARVLRPGGTAIISDPHPVFVLLGGGAAGFRARDAEPSSGLTLPYVPNLHHPMHTYVNAAVASGLEVVECQEREFTPDGLASNPAYAIFPDAVRQAFGGMPFIVVWRLRKP